MSLNRFDWRSSPSLSELGPAVQDLAGQLWQHFCEGSAGKSATCRDILLGLPALPSAPVVSDQPTVEIGAKDISGPERLSLHNSLKALGPWRKGPFNVFDIAIDAEWRSDQKWERLDGHRSPLTDRRILDVGCSSGYYMFRMLTEQPRWVLGLEPYWTYFCQFLALNRYAHPSVLGALPIKLESAPPMNAVIDTAFCMGVLYHQRSPMKLLSQLHGLLAQRGELILETLVIDAPESKTFCPDGRYAKMPNVHALPSVPKLAEWLERTGFSNILCAGVSTTTAHEQRRTDWMTFESLSDFLDPEDPDRTIEGHPAPRRAIMIAKKR